MAVERTAGFYNMHPLSSGNGPARLISALAAHIPARALLPTDRTYIMRRGCCQTGASLHRTAMAKTRREWPYKCYRNKKNYSCHRLAMARLARIAHFYFPHSFHVDCGALLIEGKVFKMHLYSLLGFKMKLAFLCSSLGLNCCSCVMCFSHFYIVFHLSEVY